MPLLSSPSEQAKGALFVWKGLDIDVARKGTFKPGEDPRRNLKGCPPGTHHIGRPKDEIKAECYGLATDAAPLILARFIKISLGENTEQVVTDQAEVLPVPAPAPSQIKAGEVVLSYVLEKAAERLELTGANGDPLPGVPASATREFIDALRRRLTGDTGKKA